MRRLYISILGLFITITLFSTIAYAWLNLATVNVIENISLTAVSNSKLEISLDGINYYESIPEDVMKDAINKMQFTDITSNDGINFFKNYKSFTNAIPNKDYLSLEFHFRTKSVYREVHLSDNILKVGDYNNPPTIGTYITSKGVLWEAKTSFLYDVDHYIEAGEVDTYYAKDAMRVAFVNKNAEPLKAKIFDLSGNEHRGFGKPYGAIDYVNKHNNEQNVAPKGPETIYELSTFSDIDPLALTYESRIITLKRDANINGDNDPYYKGVVVMNVWLEGWDADAFDAIHKDHVKMQFTFRAVIPEGELAYD